MGVLEEVGDWVGVSDGGGGGGGGSLNSMKEFPLKINPNKSCENVKFCHKITICNPHFLLKKNTHPRKNRSLA